MGESGGKEEEECKSGPDLQVCSVKKKWMGDVGNKDLQGSSMLFQTMGSIKLNFKLGVIMRLLPDVNTVSVFKYRWDQI